MEKGVWKKKHSQMREVMILEWFLIPPKKEVFPQKGLVITLRW